MAITKIQSESLNLSDNYDFTGTVTGAGESNVPAFFAYTPDGSSQSISASTTTKLNFQTELYDTNNAFDNSTNYRFTVPSGHAGKYQFNANISFYTSGGAFDRVFISLYKNGSEYIRFERRSSAIFGASFAQNSLNPVFSDNASVGDYYEIYGFFSTNIGTYTTSSWLISNYFQGFKISS